METRNYFEILGLKPSFFIDEGDLRQRYYDNARKFHPDVNAFEGAPEGSAEIAEMAALNNKAYRALNTFTGRVGYILEQAELAGENMKQVMDPVFLAKVMELNEQLTEMQMEPDEAPAERLINEVKDLETSIITELETMAHRWESAADALKSDILTEMAGVWAKYKYLLRLQQSVATFAPR